MRAMATILSDNRRVIHGGGGVAMNVPEVLHDGGETVSMEPVVKEVRYVQETMRKMIPTAA